MNSGFRVHGSVYAFWVGLGFLLVFLTSVPSAAQGIQSGPLGGKDEAPVASVAPVDPLIRPPASAKPTQDNSFARAASNPVHRFWDKENAWLFAGIAAARNLDYASTYNMLDRGREEILLPDDVVKNHAGFMALESAGTATSIGLSYLLHRTGHHKLERWVSVGHIGVAGFGAVRNYALQTKHYY